MSCLPVSGCACVCMCTAAYSCDLCARMHHVHVECVARHACVCMWSGPVLLFVAVPHRAVRVCLAYGAVWGACMGGCPEQLFVKLWAPLLLQWGACFDNNNICCFVLCSIRHFFHMKLNLLSVLLLFLDPPACSSSWNFIGAPSSSVGHLRLYGGIFVSFIFVIMLFMKCICWARGASL